MEEMKNFECAICGKLFDNLKERIKCETECLKEQEKLEKASKELEKKNAQEKINKAIDKLVADYIQLNKDIEKFYEQYGEAAPVCSGAKSFVSDLINYLF